MAQKETLRAAPPKVGLIKTDMSRMWICSSMASVSTAADAGGAARTNADCTLHAEIMYCILHATGYAPFC